MDTVDQPTSKPTRKVTAGTLGEALAVLVAILLTQVFGEDVLGAAGGAALALVLGFTLSYFVRERAV